MSQEKSYKTAVQYLKQIKRIDNMIIKKHEEVNSLRSLAGSTAMNTDLTCIQSSGSKDKIGNTCAKIADLCTEINQDILSFVNKKTDVMHTIDRLENLEERRLLYCRYFQYMSFVEIAREMNLSERHVYRVHKTAVQGIAKII